MQDESVICRGGVENIGSSESRIKHTAKDGTVIDKLCAALNHSQGLKVALRSLLIQLQEVLRVWMRLMLLDIGLYMEEKKLPVLYVLIQEVMGILEKYSELAPLHNPPNIMGVQACIELLPDTPQVGVFDTSLHTTLPAYAYICNSL